MAIEHRVKEIVNRCGLGVREREPSILFIGSSLAAFIAIAPIIKKLVQHGQRLSVYLCSSDPIIRQGLTAHFALADVVPLPFGLTTTLFLSRNKVRTVVLLEDAALLSSVMAKTLARRATPLALMSGRGMALVHMEERSILEPELMIVGEPSSSLDSGSEERVHVFAINQNVFDDDQTGDVAALLKPLVGRDRKWAERRDQKLGRWIGQKLFSLIESPVWASRLRSRIERIDDLKVLSKKLKNPKTILCLGNGPSSEDSRLKDISYDVLFRANHAWATRGFLTQPDVVFTGVKASMRKVRGAIFGLLDTNTEKVLLMTRGLRALCFGGLHYFVAGKIKGFPSDMDWERHRPTSGAIMLRAAVQLQPERLVIAGIDMFQHPAGTYPGDVTTANAYAPAHSYDKELNFILNSLDNFEGEIIIIGEVLAQEWTHFQENRVEV